MLYFLCGRFGGGSRLAAVLQLAEFFLLVSADCVLPCFRLFLCGEFHNVVHCHLALKHLDGYGRIDCYLDRDEAGRRTLEAHS